MEVRFRDIGVEAIRTDLLVGIGRVEDLDSDAWRKAGARARREAAGVGAADIALFFAPAGSPEQAAAAIVEGMLLASYQFNKYRSNSKASDAVRQLTFFRPGLSRSAAMEKSIAMVQRIMPGVYLARDL